MNKINNRNASFFLFLNAFLWGSSYVWSKILLGYLPRFSILLFCSIGGLISTLIVFRNSIKNIPVSAFVPSIIVSMFSVFSNTFCMFSLEHTSSSNTAFIVQLSIIITPIIMALIERKMPEKKIIISAVIAFCGVFLLTCNFKSFKFNVGDIFALCNAIFFSLHLVGLRKISKKVKPAHFTFIFHSTNIIAFLILAGIFEVRSINFTNFLIPTFWLCMSASICVVVFTTLIQSTALKFIRPEKAVILYTFEPVTAMILALIFIGEKLNGIQTVFGFSLILFSITYCSYKPKAKKECFGVKTSKKPILE